MIGLEDKSQDITNDHHTNEKQRDSKTKQKRLKTKRNKAKISEAQYLVSRAIEQSLDLRDQGENFSLTYLSCSVIRLSQLLSQLTSLNVTNDFKQKLMVQNFQGTETGLELKDNI